jgi:hypothetical protein
MPFGSTLADIPQVKHLLFHVAAVLPPVKPSEGIVPWFGRLSRELSAIFGLSDWFDADFGLIDTRSDRPVEPLSFLFCG